MNKSGIEWCDHTWNPITGCRHNCYYCYARTMTARFAGDIRLNKMAKQDYRMVPAADGGPDLYVLDKAMLNETGKPLVYPFGFEPTFHRYRMNVPGKLKMGNNIFVGAMADIFGAWVRSEWIKEILDICVTNPIHNYLFLTKNPSRYMEYGVPTGFDNLWYGTTVTREEEMVRCSYLPKGCKTFVSIEPVLGDLMSEENNNLLQSVDWIILGAETGRRKDKVIPKWDWIRKVILLADENGIPVFMKDSLIPIVGEENMRREFPEQLQNPTVSPKMKKKLYDICAQCKAQLKKNEMITLLARSKRGEQPKQFGFMCKECFKKFCKEIGLNVPQLAELAESITIGPEEGEVDDEKSMES